MWLNSITAALKQCKSLGDLGGCLISVSFVHLSKRVMLFNNSLSSPEGITKHCTSITGSEDHKDCLTTVSKIPTLRPIA